MAKGKRTTPQQRSAPGFARFMRAVQSADPDTLPVTAARAICLERVRDIAASLVELLRVADRIEWLPSTSRKEYAQAAADTISRAANSDDADQRAGAQLALRVLVARIVNATPRVNGDDE